MSHGESAPVATVLVVDMANVVGSVPDGWWRDRAGAAQRLLTDLVPLVGRTVPGPDRGAVRVTRVVAVLEGRARSATDTAGLDIVRAAGSGDDRIAQLVDEIAAVGDLVLVVTADRGLRARLPAGAAAVGPHWLNGLVGRT